MLESVNSIVIITAKSISITLSITGVGLINLPISAELACTLSLGNKVLHEIIINKNKKYKKTVKKMNKHLNRSINYTEKSYKIMIDKSDFESLCNIFY